MSTAVLRDAAHILTVYGFDDEDEVQFDLECTATRSGKPPLCALFVSCGCAVRKTLHVKKGSLHRCPGAYKRRHWWFALDGEPPTWLTLATGCKVTSYDDLGTAVNDLIPALTKADGDPRGRWVLGWQVRDDDQVGLMPLARLGIKPCMPKAEIWTPNAVPTIERFPAAGLEADVRDLIENKVFVEFTGTGVQVDACDATLAALERIRQERGSW